MKRQSIEFIFSRCTNVRERTSKRMCQLSPNFEYLRKLCRTVGYECDGEIDFFPSVFLQTPVFARRCLLLRWSSASIRTSHVRLSDILHVWVSEIKRKNNGRVRRVRQRAREEITIYAFFPLVIRR